MAKYIINERQNKILQEVHVPSGKFDMNSTHKLFDDVISKFLETKEKKIYKLIKKFFEQNLGISIKWSNEEYRQYLRELEKEVSFSKKGKLNSPSTIVSLGYYLIKNLYTLKKYQGLEYLKVGGSEKHIFFFFDPEIEEYVGVMELKLAKGIKDSYAVGLSHVEKEYVGRGYGSRMYLCILENCEYLFSDTILYPDSLNIWVNYLPKHSKVWALINYEFFEITKKNFILPGYVKQYVASKKELYPPPTLD